MIPRSSRARHPWKDETNRLSVRPSSRAMRLDFPRHDFHTAPTRRPPGDSR